jgi:hypothetical protein
MLSRIPDVRFREGQGVIPEGRFWPAPPDGNDRYAMLPTASQQRKGDIPSA